MGKLTSKQLKFIEVYTGNATEAAKLAGYGGDYNSLAVAANRLLKKANIVSAIQERQAKAIRPMIASREERQKLWTKMAADENQDPSIRLRASELLGKSEGDFIDKVEHSVEGTIVVATQEQLDAAYERARKKV